MDSAQAGTSIVGGTGLGLPRWSPRRRRLLRSEVAQRPVDTEHRRFGPMDPTAQAQQAERERVLRAPPGFGEIPAGRRRRADAAARRPAFVEGAARPGHGGEVRWQPRSVVVDGPRGFRRRRPMTASLALTCARREQHRRLPDRGEELRPSAPTGWALKVPPMVGDSRDRWRLNRRNRVDPLFWLARQHQGGRRGPAVGLRIRHHGRFGQGPRPIRGAARPASTRRLCCSWRRRRLRARPGERRPVAPRRDYPRPDWPQRPDRRHRDSWLSTTQTPRRPRR